MNTVNRVYELADRFNVSVSQLAKLSGIGESTLKMTRKRGGQLQIETIERICKALDISLSAFFAEDE